MARAEKRSSQQQREEKPKPNGLAASTEPGAHLPLIWVDHMTLGIRPTGPATLRFYSAIDQKVLIGACRIQTSTEHLKQIANIICQVLKHTPPKMD